MTSSSIIILFVLFWGIFLCFPKRSMLIVAFTATMLHIFLQLTLVTEPTVLWLYLMMFAATLLRLVTENKE